ncbi:hypothetical protein GCM10009584_08640 [Ornithinimicrobium humiphilum]
MSDQTLGAATDRPPPPRVPLGRTATPEGTMWTTVIENLYETSAGSPRVARRTDIPPRQATLPTALHWVPIPPGPTPPSPEPRHTD